MTMRALIQKSRREELYWTGQEWVSTNVDGWRAAARFADHSEALHELEQHEDDDEFANAFVVDAE